ncbi:MAG: universal stress protein [Proteobacteria bacterium]|nr:universal stress protein [Pseudomonadota bacterium]
MERKILAAVDGTVFSFNALRYLGQLFTDLDDIAVHLLYVVPSPPPPIDEQWIDEGDRLLCLPPEVRARYNKAKRFMEEAVLQLGRRGIEAQQVSWQVQLSRTGVAADIIHEAKKGLYDALLIGRRGIGAIEEIIGGSLSNTAAKHSHVLPIWIVDGKVNARKFLLPVDTSYNSLKAADHLGFILQGNPYTEICLLHLSTLVGGNTKPDWSELETLWGKEWCDEHLRRPDSVFHGPKQMLLERGISEKKIYQHHDEYCFSAHKPIIQHSVIDQCGTIVIGCRSKTKVKGIFSGVSEKVLNLARGVAIWIVG